jgi:hypothetical protein
MVISSSSSLMTTGRYCDRAHGACLPSGLWTRLARAHLVAGGQRKDQTSLTNTAEWDFLPITTSHTAAGNESL